MGIAPKYKEMLRLPTCGLAAIDKTLEAVQDLSAIAVVPVTVES